METISCRIADIVVGERHRALSFDAVERLAKSLKDIGLRHPVSIRISDGVMLDDGLCDGVPILVAGAHRLEAAKSLGWSHIDCVEVADDDVQAELWEIAENLHRCDLTKEQRDQHIRRYAELLETQRNLQSRQNVAIESKRADGKGHRQQGVAGQIAEETGLSKRTVERVLNPPAPKVVDIKSALEPESDHDAIIREANAIVGAWNRARQEARELAMQQMDGPVFDRSRCA
jgi:ParB family chromosome partitioning protein